MSRSLTVQSLYATKKLKVSFENESVGTLALTDDALVAFEYSDDWLLRGFSLNSLSLPLEKRVFIPRMDPFEGLFGIFNDSIPDGWGLLLMDRILRERGIEPESMPRIARLPLVGSSGMGALSYKPEIDLHMHPKYVDLDRIAQECAAVQETNDVMDLDELFTLGGSSGGARPKILTDVEGEPWIIKFPSSNDDADAGLMEYEYSLAAKTIGIEMPETRLFPSRNCPGYYGVKRFDREALGKEVQRIHMASVSALLETSHRIPNLEYTTIAKLVLKLTSDLDEVLKLFRLMCFNVLAHNQDDHSKNFAFIHKRQNNSWKLSPAFDLTYSTGMMAEHATTVAGKGKDISRDDLVECGVGMGLSSRVCRKEVVSIEEVAVPLAEKWKKSQ